ncbi:uncharacterized protein LOC135373176 [Ornithodoros turicata]|uniref:uncharacterized protein LOC135373176 n=1 Tax=Ornithodoros turicata TaxID=34597 RepID=UPI00313981AB
MRNLIKKGLPPLEGWKPTVIAMKGIFSSYTEARAALAKAQCSSESDTPSQRRKRQPPIWLQEDYHVLQSGSNEEDYQHDQQTAPAAKRTAYVPQDSQGVLQSQIVLEVPSVPNDFFVQQTEEHTSPSTILLQMTGSGTTHEDSPTGPQHGLTGTTSCAGTWTVTQGMYF